MNHLHCLFVCMHAWQGAQHSERDSGQGQEKRRGHDTGVRDAKSRRTWEAWVQTK